MQKSIFTCFEKGAVTTSVGTNHSAALCWNEHKDFPGVFLKTLVAGDQTQGLFTCHLVRIEPHATIGLHTHPASIELHEVVAGSGVCAMEGSEVTYTVGSMAVLPCNAPHEVRAGDEGLCLFAKFITVPA